MKHKKNIIFQLLDGVNLLIVQNYLILNTLQVRSLTNTRKILPFQVSLCAHLWHCNLHSIGVIIGPQKEMSACCHITEM
jgi:hypothetical protein